ncbi:hypothetical protein [Candidatus Avelusimicrobium luingense]|uniref:hypothetical protein n=1 Tax=Candidatus Avelusimicrobium luingense TaxID=3416211 RepID=UPI003D0F2488
MSERYAKKLYLENFIFARAAFLKVQVNSAYGKLYSTSLEPYLYVSIFLYNTCVAQNQREQDDLAAIADWPFGGIKNGWLLPMLNKFDKISKFML